MSNQQPAPYVPQNAWQRLLFSLGLHRRDFVSWAMYDWANSAFATTIMAAVLPVYYSNVAAANLAPNVASAYWGYTTSLALLIAAMAAPILGAIADFMGAKKRFMSVFVAAGVLFTAMFYFVGEGDWLMASAIFIVANIGFAGANIFYDSLLPHIATDEEIDKVSATGYALGYVGGGILLLINVLWILSPQTFGMADAGVATRISMFSVSIWWAIFSIPVFRYVPEPPRQHVITDLAGDSPVRSGFRRLLGTLREIREYKQVVLFMLAFWLYSDGIGTIIKMATIFGAEIGIGQTDLIGALVLTQFAGIPFTFAFGAFAKRIGGAKRGIMIGLVVYTLISIAGYFITTAWHFWALALAVATVQGGTQALSRSLFGTIIPRSKSSEFYGFFGVSSKFAGILGPLIFAVVSTLAGSSRLSIISLIFFFLGGIILLSRVDVEEGQRVAQAKEEELTRGTKAG